MSDSKGAKIEKISRLLGDLVNQQEKIKAAKKSLKDSVKETENADLMARLKELKDARKTISADIKELQAEVERQVLEDNPDIKDFRETVLELEEEEADLKVSLREIGSELLVGDKIVEIEIPTTEMPMKAQLMRGVVANINGKEQNL